MPGYSPTPMPSQPTFSYDPADHINTTQTPAPTAPTDPKAGAKPAVSWTGYITPQDLSKIIGGLSTSQVDNPQASLIDALSHSLGMLTPAQSQAAEKELGKEGGPLLTDVTDKLQGVDPKAAGANPYGFDPLSYGQFFKTTLGPYLASIGKQAQGEVAGYGSQMASALAGASPQLKAAYAQTEPGMQEAQSLENASLAGLAQSSPMFDTLIANLQAAQTGAKAAQTQAAEEPYIAQAVTGIGSPTNQVGAGQSAANMATLYQAALQNLATNSGGALVNPASTGAQTPLSAATNPYANLLPGMAAPVA